MAVSLQHLPPAYYHLCHAHPPCCCLQIYTIGRGDDASSWAVTDYSLETYSVDMGSWFSQYSDLNSDPYDPMPLAPVNANQTGGYVDESGNLLNVFK